MENIMATLKEQQEMDQMIRERLAEMGYSSSASQKPKHDFTHNGVDYYHYSTPTVEDHCHEQEAIDRLRAKGITHIERYCCEDNIDWYNRYVDSKGNIISEEEC